MGCILKGGGGLYSRLVVGAVLLAAGSGSRMGHRPKCLLELGGVPLIRRTLIALSGAGVDEVVVVLGHHAEAIEPVVSGFPVTIVRNPRPDDGQVSSQRLGLAALTGKLDAVLVALVFFFSWLPKPALSEQVPMPVAMASWVDGDANWNLRTAVPFLLLGALAGAGLWGRGARPIKWWLAWLGMVLVGCVAEWGQLFIAERHCDPGDVAWAATGAAAGLLMIAAGAAAGAGVRALGASGR